MVQENTLPIVFDNVVTDGDTLSLKGSYCSSCDLYHFPIAGTCRNCLGDADAVNIGSKATIYSVTTVRVRPPLGLPNPYSVSYVDLEQVPLRIFALLDPSNEEDYEIGQKVELSLLPIGVNNDNQACLRPCFSPID